MIRKCYFDCVLLVIAWLFVTVFSYTTSPLFHVWGNTPDSPIFQIIGKYWAEGYVPYRDLWDMKGPYILFVNVLGYALTGTKTGVYLIQCLSLFLTLAVIFRTFLLRFPNGWSFLLTILSLAGLSYIYEGGNMTEEYILLPLSLSFYYILRWVDLYDKGRAVRHLPMCAFLYGMVLGLCLMSRLTNALGLCSAVAVIAVTLLCRREFKNLLANVGMFVLGFGLATIPFVIYFFAHAALQDMWNATFLFALGYAGNTQMHLLEKGIHYFVLSYLNSMLLMGVGVYVAYKCRAVTVRSSLYFLSGAVPFLWFCQGNGYGHYGMIVYPMFAWAVMELLGRRLWLAFWTVSLAIIVGALSKVRFMYIMYHWDNTDVAACRQLLDREPSLDKTSFVAYGCDPNLYLDLDVRPAAPVFSLQEMGRDRIPEWKDFLSSMYREKHPRWILVCREMGGDSLIIEPMLEESYLLVSQDTENNLELYRKR